MIFFKKHRLANNKLSRKIQASVSKTIKWIYCNRRYRKLTSLFLSLLNYTRVTGQYETWLRGDSFNPLREIGYKFCFLRLSELFREQSNSGHAKLRRVSSRRVKRDGNLGNRQNRLPVSQLYSNRGCPKWWWIRVLSSGRSRLTPKVGTEDQPPDWRARNRVRTVFAPQAPRYFEEVSSVGKLMKKKRHKEINQKRNNTSISNGLSPMKWAVVKWFSASKSNLQFIQCEALITSGSTVWQTGLLERPETHYFVTRNPSFQQDF